MRYQNLKIPEYQQRALPLEGGTVDKWWGCCYLCGDSTVIDAPFPEGYCYRCHEEGEVQRFIGESLKDINEQLTQHIRELIDQGYLDANPSTWWQGWKIEAERYTL